MKRLNQTESPIFVLLYVFFFFFFFFIPQSFSYTVLHFRCCSGSCGGRRTYLRTSPCCRLYFSSFRIIESILVTLKIKHRLTLRKHAYSNIQKNSPTKTENFQIQNSDIFYISAQNIDCGYSLDPLH